MLDVRSPAVPDPLPPARATPDPHDICRAVTACVAIDFGLDVADLEVLMRGSQRVALARQIAMYLAHVGFGLGFEAIGRAFGRDRTTVAHACRIVEDARDDIWFDCRVATLELICRSASGGDAR
ncbi:helix-turn-helix domain-containing protein [soil metagenome]